MKKYIFSSLLIVFTAFTTVHAQSDKWRTKNIMMANWEIGLPINSNYLTSASLAGANLEFRHFINPKFSMGMAIHWNTFEQYLSPRVFEEPDGSRAVFTDIVPQVYVLPILLKGHYYFDAGNNFKPYAGLGLGAQYSKQSVYYNIFVSDTQNWGFVARPELGLMYQFKELHGGLNFNAGFNYATNKNETFRIDNLKHIGFSIGGWWNLY
jgi:outer membrane protein W